MVRAIFSKKKKNSQKRAKAQVTAATLKRTDVPLPPVPEGPKTKSETRRGVRQRNAARRAKRRQEKAQRQNRQHRAQESGM